MPDAMSTPTYLEMRKTLKPLVRSNLTPFWLAQPCLSCPERTGDRLHCVTWIGCRKRQLWADVIGRETMSASSLLADLWRLKQQYVNQGGNDERRVPCNVDLVGSAADERDSAVGGGLCGQPLCLQGRRVLLKK